MLIIHLLHVQRYSNKREREKRDSLYFLSRNIRTFELKIIH